MYENIICLHPLGKYQLMFRIKFKQSDKNVTKWIFKRSFDFCFK